MSNVEHAANVAISQDFLESYTALPRKIQSKVSDFLDKFRKNPKSPGINYEKIRDAFDPGICSVRIDNTYRGIVVRQPDSSTYILLWVDHHDEAYEWARRKRCAVNPTTGTIQLFSVMERESEIVSAAIYNTAENQPCSAGLFDDISDADLKRLGAPEELIPFIRSIKSEEQLSKKGVGILPHDVYTALSYAANFDLDEVFEMLADERAEETGEIDTQDFAAALARPSSMASFTVIEDDDDLRRIIEAPLERWRVFLHPMQRALTTARFSGPARVMGAAGTGKTVVAMHRAKHLASSMKDGERMFFTTFTVNLASDIHDNLLKICTAQEMSRIETINIDEWVKRFRAEHGLKSEITYDNNGELRTVWREALNRLRINTDTSSSIASLSELFSSCGVDDAALVSFCMDEWEQTAAAQDAFTEDAYLKADRTGRGIRLGRAKRAAVMSVFREYMNIMRERNICDIHIAMAECREILEDMTPPYRHIIADEGQDLSPSALRLIRALTEEADNDIFIVGDANQRIYKHACSLAKCGIQIRGKSSVLKINYRTTGEIQRAAFSVLPSPRNGGDERYRAVSLTSGFEPVIRSFRNAAEEFDFIIGEVSDLESEGVPLSAICIATRSIKLRDALMKRFEESGVPCCKIEQNGVEPNGRGQNSIRFATMHRIKGLEFQYIFIASLNSGIIPFINADEEDIIRERHLLYVAMTRAQRGVWLTNYWKPSQFIIEIEQCASKSES